MTPLLSRRQELVLLLRFGQGPRTTTHAEVGEALGVSAQAVQRVERAALRRLRFDAVNPIMEWCGWDEV